MFLPFEMDRQTVLYNTVNLQRLVTHISTLNNTFFYETNTFYDETSDFPVENHGRSKVPLTGSNVALGLGQL
jgi:hypothetical protein